MLPHNTIFGGRKRGNREPTLDESLIVSLLVKEMPALKGGRILSMDSNHYKKGTYLNIEFITPNEDIYTIKAKYKKRKHRIEILSLSESENPFRREEDSDVEEEIEVVEEEM